MTIQKTPPNAIVPLIDVEDEKLKKILEDYNKIFFEIMPAIYSDIKSLNERIEALGG
jgi:hypothetical protein